MMKRLGLAILALLTVAPLYAQNAEDAVRFKITAGGRDLYKLAIPLPLGDKGDAKSAQDVLSNDLALAGFFKVLDPAAFLANVEAEQLTINAPDWRQRRRRGCHQGARHRLRQRGQVRVPAVRGGQGSDAGAVEGLSRPGLDGAPAGAPVRRRGRALLHQRGRASSPRRSRSRGDTGTRRRDICRGRLGRLRRACRSRIARRTSCRSWAPAGSEIAFTQLRRAASPTSWSLPPSGGGKPQA